MMNSITTEYLYDVSIVIPLLNEAESLPELEAWIRRTMEKHGLSYEIIFIDDGSTDKSWPIIMKMTEQSPLIRGIKFRRNYGKSAALNTGFNITKGEVIFTMDADLQDSPEEIPEMYEMIVKEGYDVVSGWKKKRYDNRLTKNLPSKLFNWAARKMSGIPLHDFNCGLKAYRHKVIYSIEVYGEMHRYIPIIVKWAGFRKIGEKVVQHAPRKYGSTKFGMSRFVNGFLDLLSIFFMGKFGKRPMHFFGLLGSIIFLIGVIAAIYLGINKLVLLNKGIAAPLITSNPYFYISLLSTVIGSQLFLAGFLGELITRNATERNAYQLDEITGFEENDTLILDQNKSQSTKVKNPRFTDSEY